jgi:hypothetical protein
VKRRVSLLLAAALQLAPLTAVAELLEEAGSAADDESADRTAASREDLHEALERFEQARRRHLAAEEAYENWRQRKWPRGEAKAKILAEREAARRNWETMRGELPRVIESARRAGIPPGELRPFEEAAREETASR